MLSRWVNNVLNRFWNLEYEGDIYYLLILYEIIIRICWEEITVKLQSLKMESMDAQTRQSENLYMN
jgi:hypothetical protein